MIYVEKRKKGKELIIECFIKAIGYMISMFYAKEIAFYIILSKIANYLDIVVMFMPWSEKPEKHPEDNACKQYESKNQSLSVAFERISHSQKNQYQRPESSPENHIKKKVVQH
jgi:predicted component of viral defense system (DUF524 family)